METLGRNRVFSVGDIEGLKNSINNLMEQAIQISRSFNEQVKEVEAWANRIPDMPEGNILKLVMPFYAMDYVYDDYAELQNRSEMILNRIIMGIPGIDREAADLIETVKEGVLRAGETADDLRTLLEPGMLNLSYYDFCRMADRVCPKNKVLTDEEVMKQSLQNLGYVPSAVYTSDPVNVATGNFLFQEEDIQIWGVPFLNIRRYYNSLNKRKGIFGRGWSSNFEMLLEIKNDKKFRVLRSDGTYVSFTKEDDHFTPDKEGNSCLWQNRDEYIYQEERIRMYFSNQGKIIRIEDNWETGIDFIYDAEGNLEKLISDCNRKLNFYYENGFLIMLCDDSGKEIKYEYEHSRLIAVINPMGEKHCYEYGKSNRIEKLVNEKGVTVLCNQYDERKRIVSQILPDGEKILYQYPKFKNYTEVTYQDGHHVRYYYDEKFRNTMVTDRKNHTIYEPSAYQYQNKQNLIGGKLIAERNDKGQIIRLKRGEFQDEISYGDNGCPQKILLGEGGEFYFEYDECNRMVKKADGNGNVRKYSYDLCDRLTSIIYPDGMEVIYKYDAAGNLVCIAESTGKEYALEYDSFRHITKITLCGKTAAEIRYNSLGHAVKLVTAYDEFGAERGIKSETGGFKEEFPGKEEYDAAGNVIRQVFADGSIVELVYDCMNRPVRIVRNKDSEFCFSYENGNCTERIDPLGNQTLFKYDKYGTLVSVKDSMGNEFETEQKRQVLPKSAEEKAMNPDFVIENEENISRSGVEEIRDNSGRLIQRNYSGGAVSHYEYGAGRQLKKIIHCIGQEVLEELRYEYDKAGNCIVLIKKRKDCPEDSGRFEYEYDELQRLIRVRKDGELLTEYEYDKYGNRLKKKSIDGICTYRYDDTGVLCYTDGKEISVPEEQLHIICRKSENAKEYEIQNGESSYKVLYRGLPEAVLTEGGKRYLLTDHLGTVIRVIRDDGSTESIHQYDEFGISMGTIPLYAGYGGYIPVTGDIYATESRYYVPSQGRFLTRDSWCGNTGNPQTWNRWIYAVNNPIRYKDASGFSPEAAEESYAVPQTIPGGIWDSYMEYYIQEAASSCKTFSAAGSREGQELQNVWLEAALGQIIKMPESNVNNLQLLCLNNPWLASALYADGMFTGGMAYNVSCSRMEGISGYSFSAGDVAYLNGIETTQWDRMLNGNSMGRGMAAAYAADVVRVAAVLLREEVQEPRALKTGEAEKEGGQVGLSPSPAPGTAPDYHMVVPKEYKLKKELLVYAAVEGYNVTEQDLQSLPEEERLSQAEFEELVKERKILKWSDPSYRMTPGERTEAKKFIKEYFETEYTYTGMDEEGQKKYGDIVMLQNKTNPGAGVMAGGMEAVPFWEFWLETLDKTYGDAMEAGEIDSYYRFSDYLEATKNQFPIQAAAGYAGMTVAEYQLGTQLIKTIPAVDKAIKAAGDAAAKGLGRLGAGEKVQQAVALHTADILGDTTVDIALDTIPNAAKDIRDGENAQQVAGNAFRNVALNMTLNTGSDAAIVAYGKLADGVADIFKQADEVIEGGTDADLTIMLRNSSRGNPSAITHFDVELNTRQKNLLQQLPNCDSSIVVNKGDVSLNDLAALTAKTGDEFAMFTRGSQRMIIRGNTNTVNINGSMAQELYNAGFKWSGHTHPGTGINVKFASEGDMLFWSNLIKHKALF